MSIALRAEYRACRMKSSQPASTTSETDVLATSGSLLERARRRDARAWEQLVELYTPLVYFWCRRGLLPDQDIADVVQEVFRAVVTGIDGFRRERPGDTFRGWLRTVTRSKIADHYRGHGMPQSIGGSDIQRRLDRLEAPDDEELNDPAEASAQQALLYRGFEAIRDEFQPQVWRSFWGTVVEGRAVGDVAAELDMRPGTVRVYKCRVSQRLRQALGDVE
jgi:RNA polymerase sigma-70 factor (ECF subfamily)